jgi:hypothetical protein
MIMTMKTGDPGGGAGAHVTMMTMKTNRAAARGGMMTIDANRDLALPRVSVRHD